MDESIGPGRRLRSEREALGVSVREVADTLNLSITVVQALEDDDYKQLPGAVFIRGYVRAYARLLDLDPVPLLDQLPAAGGRVVPVAREPELAEWIRRRPGLVLGALSSVVLVLLIAAVLWLWPEEGLDSLWKSIDGSSVTVPPVEADAAWEWEQAQQPVQTDPATSAAQPAPDGSGASAATSDSELAANSIPAESVAASATEASGVQRLTVTGTDTLTLRFSADCWVEISDVDGVVLYRELHRPDDVLDLVGQAPFRVKLGHAPGVELAFRGEAIALAPHTRNNVAALVLGQ
jgi:cytoskeleton protein RodZ